jgi:hypothetical protein
MIKTKKDFAVLINLPLYLCRNETGKEKYKLVVEYNSSGAVIFYPLV